jgi:hypothetical protein
MTEHLFRAERAAFARLKAKFDSDPALREALERSLVALIQRYDTRIYENRFVVGGAIEVFLKAALSATGVSSELVGELNPRIDLGLGRGQNGLSVKASLTRSDTIRLINVLGSSSASQWSEGTVFVLAEIGLVYADPGLLPNAARRTPDAWVISRRELVGLTRSHPECHIKCAVALKSNVTGVRRTASRDAALTILTELNSPLAAFLTTPAPANSRNHGFRTRRTAARASSLESKQDVLNDIADFMGSPRHLVSRGSTERKQALLDIVNTFDLPIGPNLTKPELAQAIVEDAGLSWESRFDSRATVSGGGSTVTTSGLKRLRDAVRVLVDRELGGDRPSALTLRRPTASPERRAATQRRLL